LNEYRRRSRHRCTPARVARPPCTPSRWCRC
jgi:hypothetical protein